MNAFLRKKNLRLPLPQSHERFSFASTKNIVIGVVALVVLLGVLQVFQGEIKNAFYVITAPVSKTFWAAGSRASGFFNPIFNAGGITRENSNLKQENQNLLAQIASLQDAVKSNQAINEVIQNTKQDNFQLVVAQSIGLDSVNDFLLINKGSQDGISENMPVISSTKVVYGKVYKVYKNFSQVMLISGKQSVVDAKINNVDPLQQPVLGAVKGAGNLSFYLDLVASGSQINPGDVLLTSGQEGIFPANLLLGKITLVNKNDLQPFQTAKVEPLQDAKSADNLFIITDYKKTK